MKHKGDGIFSGKVTVAEDVQITGQLTVGGDRIRGVLQSKGASWVRPAGPLQLPVNQVPVVIPREAELQSAFVTTLGGPGSCNISVWKDNISNYPPTVAGDITGGNNIVITNGLVLKDNLVGWQKTLLPDDVVLFTLSGVSTFSSVFVTLIMKEL